jgi:integrase
MAALRAALNNAHDQGDVTNDMAWRVALRAVENADGRRDTYLDLNQRALLISKSGADIGVFLRGLSLVPLRPGALASLTAGQFNNKLGVLSVGKDKAGRDRKIKLPPETAKFFAEHTKDKLPSAPLLSRADGAAWNKDSWKKPIKAAALASEFNSPVSAYTIRHSVITDLVTNGLDLLTVAQLSGTSVIMIEKHYGHHRAEHAAKALAGLAI